MQPIYVDEMKDGTRYSWYVDEMFNPERGTVNWRPALAADVRDGVATGRYEVLFVTVEKRRSEGGEYRIANAVGEVVVPAGDHAARMRIAADL